MVRTIVPLYLDVVSTRTTGGNFGASAITFTKERSHPIAKKLHPCTPELAYDRFGAVGGWVIPHDDDNKEVFVEDLLWRVLMMESEESLSSLIAIEFVENLPENCTPCCYLVESAEEQDFQTGLRVWHLPAPGASGDTLISSLFSRTCELYTTSFVARYSGLNKALAIAVPSSEYEKTEVVYDDRIVGQGLVTFPVVPLRIPSREFVFHYMVNATRNPMSPTQRMAFILQMAIYGSARHFTIMKDLFFSIAESKPENVSFTLAELPPNRAAANVGTMSIFDSSSVCFELILWFFVASVQSATTHASLMKSAGRLRTAKSRNEPAWDSEKCLEGPTAPSPSDILSVGLVLHFRAVWLNHANLLPILAKTMTRWAASTTPLRSFLTNNPNSGDLNDGFLSQMILTMNGLAMTGLVYLNEAASVIASLDNDSDLKQEATKFLKKESELRDEFAKDPHTKEVGWSFARILNTKKFDDLKQNDYPLLCCYTYLSSGDLKNYRGFETAIISLTEDQRSKIASFAGVFMDERRGGKQGYKAITGRDVEETPEARKMIDEFMARLRALTASRVG